VERGRAVGVGLSARRASLPPGGVDLATGRRTLFKEFAPVDRTGLLSLREIFVTDDLRSGSGEPRPEQRKYPRLKASVPVELSAPGSDVPFRCATSDLSEGGCYIETMFPFPIGTILEMSLQINGTLLALGTVVTCYTQVGNGIEFTRMLPEDQEELRDYLRTAEQTE
jgi:hypothetical protein